MERLFFDGGMGTVLQDRGLTGDPVRLNLTHGEAIVDIHRAYLAAGARVLTANTFGAYTHKHSDAEVIIEAALAHAHAAVADAPRRGEVRVALDMGPLGQLLEPFGDMTFEEAYALFSRAAQAGARYGADLILAETFYCLTELEAAVRAAKETGLPVFASLTYDAKGRTTMGSSIAAAAERLTEWGVAAAGMNCGLGPDVYTVLLPELLAATELPLLVQPNAGLPEMADGRAVYSVAPQDFARMMAEMDALAAGRVLHVGGCCGTTPAHIAAMAAACG